MFPPGPDRVFSGYQVWTEPRREDGKMKDERRGYIELLISLATADLLGKGATPRGMISNLRSIADALERMIPDGADSEGRENS